MAEPYPIPRQTRQTDIFVGNGSAVYGPFSNLKIFDVVDVQVLVKAVGDVGFSVQAVTVTKTSNLPFDTFTVTFPTLQPATTQIVVRSARVAERSAGVDNGTRLDMTALEKELSKQASVQQEVRRDINRAVLADFGQDPLTLDGAIGDGRTLMRQGDRLVEGPDIVGLSADAQAARDEARGFVADAIASTSVPIYSTMAGMSAVSVKAGVLAIRVNGQDVVGDKLGGYFIDQSNGGPVAFTTAAPDSRAWYRSYENAFETREFQLDAYRRAVETTDDAALERILALISGDGIFRITRPHHRATVLATRHVFTDKNIIFGGGRNIILTTANAGVISVRRTVSSQKSGYFKVEHCDVTYNVGRIAGYLGAAFAYYAQFIGSFDQPCGGFVDVNFRTADVNNATITPGSMLYVYNGWYGFVRDCSIVGPIGSTTGNLVVFDGLSAQWSIDNPLARWIDSTIVIKWMVLPALNFAAAPSFTPYETIRGSTSGATATYCGTDYGVSTRILTTDNVGAFINGETIVGLTSGYAQAVASQQTQKYPCEGFDITGGACLSSNHFVDAFMPNDISRRAVGLRFLGGHGNCILSTVHLAFFDQVTLIGGEPLYRQNNVAGADIEMSSCGSFYIGGFTFTGTGSAATAIALATCGDGVIAPNNITLRGIGVQMTAGCARIDVHPQENLNGVTTPYAIDNTCPLWPATNGIRFLGLHDRPEPDVPRINIVEGTDVIPLGVTDPGVNRSATMFYLQTATAGAIGAQFMFANFATNGGTDSKFRVRGDGAVFSDGGTAMNTPADYAERFEWTDGNPANEDRIGWTVKFSTGVRTIERAVEGDADGIIGVVSGNPTIIGDNGHSWTKKYLRDDFNRPLWEDIQIAEWVETVTDEWTGDGPAPRSYEHGVPSTEISHSVVVGEGDHPATATISASKRMVLNPSFDPDRPYEAREDRPEWSAIGLLGKLRLVKGQPVNPRWLKMQDISATVEEWLVR